MKKFNFDFNLESIKESIMEMDTKNKVILGVSALAVVGVLVFGGYALSTQSGGNENKLAVTEKNETSLEDGKSENKNSESKEEKEENKENKKEEKKENEKTENKKEENKDNKNTENSDSKKEENKKEEKKEEPVQEPVQQVQQSQPVEQQPVQESKPVEQTQVSKPSTNTENQTQQNQTSNPSTNAGGTTQESKPVEQKPVEQKPVVEEKPSTPSWWGEGKSEAEIMKTVTDALVWKNEITGETYYGLNGLKFGWNADNATYGGLVIVSNPYGVRFTSSFDGGWYNSTDSTNVGYFYENFEGDEAFIGKTLYVSVSAPAAITFSEMLALYGM